MFIPGCMASETGQLISMAGGTLWKRLRYAPFVARLMWPGESGQADSGFSWPVRGTSVI